MIELLHLCAGYKATQVLFDITADIKPGHLIGIIGPNGCGKSTLLKTVAHLLSPTTGEIRIPAAGADYCTVNGKAVADLTLEADGLTFKGVEDGVLVFEAVSGSFSFATRLG